MKSIDLNSMNTKMRALIATGYGPPEVLHLAEVERPRPKPNELLIRVHTSTLTAADSMMRRGDPAFARLFLGLRKPKAPIPGTGLAGTVDAVGSAVTKFSVGDEVFGEAGLHFGAHAEFVCVPENGVILPKPEFLSFSEASTLCDGPMTSYNFLRTMAGVKPGQHVLINGASGALGTAAIQLANTFGARVTGVCSTANIELVTSLGAEHVIDYTTQDFTQNHDCYDIIYDTVGKSSYQRCNKALTPGGMYLSPVLSIPLLFQTLWTKIVGTKKARFDATGLRPASVLKGYLRALIAMVEEGTLRTVVERKYELDNFIEAHRHVDTGHKKGTVLLQIAQTALSGK